MSDSTTQPLDREAALKRGYALATQDLRNAHEDEFNKFRVARTKELGHEWTPKKSEKERAAEALAAILHEFPELFEWNHSDPDDEEGGSK